MICFLENATDDVRINTNTRPNEVIDEDIKTFIRSLFVCTDDFQRILNTYLKDLPEKYDVYHLRFGDIVFTNDFAEFNEDTINIFRKITTNCFYNLSTSQFTNYNLFIRHAF